MKKPTKKERFELREKLFPTPEQELARLKGKIEMEITKCEEVYFRESANARILREHSSSPFMATERDAEAEAHILLAARLRHLLGRE